MGRVTQSMMNIQLQRNLNTNLNRMNDYQNQMATGRRINRPSDDPVGLSYSMRYRTDLTATEQFQSNVDTAMSWMDFSDTMLGQVTDVLARVRELTVQGSNGSNPTSALDAIKKEILQLTEQLTTIGNSNFNGKHVFNGQITDKEPYNSQIRVNTVSVPGSGASVTGNVDVSAANVTALNNTLDIDLEGEALTVTLPTRDYSVSGGAAAFAADLQEAINSASALGNTVKVTAGSPGNNITIQSDKLGVASNVTVIGGSLASSWFSTAGDLTDLVAADGIDPQPKYEVRAISSESDEGEIQYEIASSVYLPVNIPGSKIFGSAAEEDNVFKVLQNIINELDAGNPAGVTKQLGKFDTRMDKILETRADLGSKINRVQLAEERLKDIGVNLQTLHSKVEDADMAELITNLKTNENVYQASLSVGSKIITPTLVDFLK